LGACSDGPCEACAAQDRDDFPPLHRPSPRKTVKGRARMIGVRAAPRNAAPQDGRAGEVSILGVQAGIGFTKQGNCFTHISDPEDRRYLVRTTGYRAIEPDLRPLDIYLFVLRARH
jgi:hypothetical protein